MRRDKKKHGYRTTHKITDYCKCGRDSNYDIKLPEDIMDDASIPTDSRKLERKRKTKKIKELIDQNTKQNVQSEEEHNKRIDKLQKDIDSLSPFIKPVFCPNFCSHITLENALKIAKKKRKFLIGDPLHRHRICNPSNHHFRDESANIKERIEDYQLYQGEITNDMLDLYS